MAIARNLKNALSHTFSVFILYIMVLIISVVSQFVSIKDRASYQIIFNVLVLMLAMWTIIYLCAFFLKLQTLYFSYAIGFSSTRKSFYISTQILKVISAIVVAITYLIFINIIGIIFNSAESAKGLMNIFFLFTSILIFATTLGEFLGHIINITNKSILFIILFSILSSIFSMLFIMYFATQILDFKPMNNTYLYTTIGFIFLGVSTVFSVLNWFMIREYTLK